MKILRLLFLCYLAFQAASSGPKLLGREQYTAPRNGVSNCETIVRQVICQNETETHRKNLC